MKKCILLLIVLLCVAYSMQAQNVGIGIATPTERLHVNGNIRFSGALMPNNLPGTTGQILISQGAGVAPIWGSVAGNQVVSTSLSGSRTVNTAAWAAVTGMTVTFTARSTSAFVMFSASGYNSMSFVQFRVFNVTTGTATGIQTNEKIQNYDSFTGTITPWICSANGLITGLTIGTTYTLRVDGQRNGILGTYDAIIDTAVPGNHMNISVIQ